jgi:hypothetical protein
MMLHGAHAHQPPPKSQHMQHGTIQPWILYRSREPCSLTHHFSSSSTIVPCVDIAPCLRWEQGVILLYFGSRDGAVLKSEEAPNRIGCLDRLL